MCWSIFYDYFWQLDRHGLGPYIFQLKKLPQLFVCLILAFFFFLCSTQRRLDKENCVWLFRKEEVKWTHGGKRRKKK